MNQPIMLDFLSSHSSPEKVVAIQVESKTVYLEGGREANTLNFDFVVQGLTDKNLSLKFLLVFQGQPPLIHICTTICSMAKISSRIMPYRASFPK